MASILVWTCLYFASRAVLPFSATYGKWDRERQYKARGLVPSSVFLLGIVPFSIWALTSDANLRDVRVTGATSSSLLISAIATGYFIYDSLVVLYHFKDDGVAYLIHGVLCMVPVLCFRFLCTGPPCFSRSALRRARWSAQGLGFRVQGAAPVGAWFRV